MTTRKDFLAAGALAAVVPAAAAAAPSPPPSPSASAPPSPQRPSFPKLNFDLAAFDALLDKPAAHKHLFASVKLDGGEVLSAMRNTLKAYAEIGTAMSDVLPVAVLYHGPSIALGFDDAMWREYFLPIARKNKKSDMPEAKDFASVVDAKTTGNPFMKKQGGEWDSSIPSLVADADARLFICNNATHGFADFIASFTKQSSADVYRTLAQHLVPNAMLVPAGVWAVHAIQERRFTLLQTSV